jgi:hypothetical protein
MAKVAIYVWILTLIGNVTLALFLVAQSYYIRFGWLTASTVIAVAVDALMWWCHTYNHHLFEPVRMFIFYALFWLLNVLVIFEAWKLGERRVRIPVEIQLGLAIVGLLAHRFHFPFFTYYFECFTRFFNLCVIIYFVTIFSQENRYDRP